MTIRERKAACGYRRAHPVEVKGGRTCHACQLSNRVWARCSKNAMRVAREGICRDWTERV